MNSKIYSKIFLDDLRNHLEKSQYRYISYPKFIFLCGRGYDHSNPDSYIKTNRGIIQKYIQRLADNVYFVLSEKLWENDYIPNIDLLTFEEFLAEVSDAIILFVESPGSFCELGAFAYAEKLFSQKLYIILDDKYKDAESFLNIGPIAKAKQENSTVIFASVDEGALLDSSDLRLAMSNLIEEWNKSASAKNRKTINVDAQKVSLSSFILEILELIRITQPIFSAELIALYKQVKGFTSFTFIKKDGTNFYREIKPQYILNLLEEVRLVVKTESGYTFPNYKNMSSFMFDYSDISRNRTRNRLLCKKYKHGGYDAVNYK